MSKKPQVSKRASTRTTVVSKAMRIVDKETRREVRDKRITTLEADNYEEEATIDFDDAYGDDEGEVQKKKKNKSSNGTKNNGLKTKWNTYKMKSLDRIIHEHGYERNLINVSHSNIVDIMDDDDDNDNDIANNQKINYLSIQSEPSLLPVRHFCSVCGQNGRYSCTRCGMRTCCVKCFDSHKETRCLKFSY